MLLKKYAAWIVPHSGHENSIGWAVCGISRTGLLVTFILLSFLHAFAAKCSNPRGLASSLGTSRIILLLSICYVSANGADASQSGFGLR